MLHGVIDIALRKLQAAVRAARRDEPAEPVTVLDMLAPGEQISG